MTVPNRPKEGIYTIWKKKFQEKLHGLEDMALNSTIYIYIYMNIGIALPLLCQPK